MFGDENDRVSVLPSLESLKTLAANSGAVQLFGQELYMSRDDGSIVMVVGPNFAVMNDDEIAEWIQNNTQEIYRNYHRNNANI